MTIDEATYKAMPAELQALFRKSPNPGSDEVLAGFPQAGGSRPRVETSGDSVKSKTGGFGIEGGRPVGFVTAGYGDSGSAARFFYCAKASRAEREAGLDGMEQRAFGQSGGAQGALAGGDDEYLQNSIGLNRIKRVRNHHPTVKPIALMRWLVRLVMPPGGTVLDPFAGSGTTLMAAVLEGFNCIGIEREQDYIEIAGARIEWAKKQAEGAGAQGQLGLPATPAG
jgi:site-specific DNA-methyltransferase (adenine-specific)